MGFGVSRLSTQTKTVHFVTHDLATAQKKYCDRFMLLRDGSVALIGNQSMLPLNILQNMTDEEQRIFE